VILCGPPKTYTAKAVDDLKKTDPEGYKIYQQFFAPLKTIRSNF
jgi:hypothetical protein